MGDIMIINIRKTVVSLIMILSMCSLFIGCGQKAAELNQSPTEKETYAPTVTTSNPTQEKSGDNSENEGDIQDSLSLKSWIGDYTFSEHVPPDENMYYTISIHKEDNGYYADISIDGFQTMERLRAKVLGNETSIKLVFSKYLPDNLRDIYKEGETLLSLEKGDTNLLTTWGGIQPLILDNYESNKEYFQKENS